MPSIRIHLDDAICLALDRVAEERQRAAFIRGAIVRAIRDTEEARTRRAYAEQPDSESEADDWLNCEEYNP